MRNIRVLIVDDSAQVCRILTKILNRAPGIEVVGAANDPYIVREKIRSLNPDVLTLDVEMPRMGGVSFLSNIMKVHPLPVVMVSSPTESGTDFTLEALENGAIDFVTKPKIELAHALDEYAAEIIEKVRIAADSKLRPRNRVELNVNSKNSADAILQKHTHRQRKFRTTDKLIAIGASTGGTEAIKSILEVLPADCPGVVITQHIPEAFSKPFSMRMDSISAMTVCQAEDGQLILPGHVYIAPGNEHLLVEAKGNKFVCRLNNGPTVNRHRPSVDVLFRSVAQNVGKNAIGVLLTGMGDDGALGMEEMKQSNLITIAQDEASSIVWGMPGEAVKRGCVDNVLSLSAIPKKLVAFGKN
ncbi:MAG: chemotaxis response regulator protein-glutamate methylesterase [Thiohalomonadales bacterium]